MSSQPHAPQLGHHDGSHQHADHHGPHHHGHGGHFDHVLAGLRHLEVTHRERINELERESADADAQRAALLREFQKHADIHEVGYHHLQGLEDKTYPVESQLEAARHYLWGMIGGMSIAVVLGVYFSVSTLVADSFLLLLLGSVVVAVVIEVFASVVLRALLGASAVRPQNFRKVNVTLVVFGVAFFALLAAFAWLRFQTDSPLVALLPFIMVSMELAAIFFAGACDCGYRMYRWSGVFHERHRHLLQRKAAVEDQLASKHVDLMGIEHRIREHEEAHAAAHRGIGHTEESHHESHYETVSH